MVGIKVLSNCKYDPNEAKKHYTISERSYIIHTLQAKSDYTDWRNVIVQLSLTQLA